MYIISDKTRLKSIDEKALENAESLNLIAEYIGKTNDILGEANKPLVAISGGSDSDIMLDIISHTDQKDKCVYIFYDTGLEWKATRNHLDYLESAYNIKIHHRRPKKPIPTAVKLDGVPFATKLVAEFIGRLQKHDFDFVSGYNKTFDELYAEYPRCKGALEWYCGTYDKITQFDIRSIPFLKEFLRDNPPQMLISAKCCDDVKKRVAVAAAKEFNCDLMVTGIRKAEGGARAGIKRCQYESHGYLSFAPLFWFKDADKKMYEKLFDIKHSDCYEIYGLPRTGCAACPFAMGNFENELAVMKQYEPNLYKAANNIFGTSYEYTRAYKEYRNKMRKDEKAHRSSE